MGVLIMEDGIRNNTVIAAPKKKWIQHYMQGEEPKISTAETTRPGSANHPTSTGPYISRSRSPATLPVYGNGSGIAAYELTVRNRSFDEVPNKPTLAPKYVPEYVIRNNTPIPPVPQLLPRSQAVDFMELKKRSGADTREVHNKLEKNRRAHLRECFEFLRKQLPPEDDKKLSNLGILKNALRYIQGLKRKDREFERSVEQLAREKIMLQQRLYELRREASSAAREPVNFLPSPQTQVSPGQLTYGNVEAHNLNFAPSGTSETFSRMDDEDECSYSTSTASETGNVSDIESGAGPEARVQTEGSVPNPVRFNTTPRYPISENSPESPPFHQELSHMDVIVREPPRMKNETYGGFLMNGTGELYVPVSFPLLRVGVENSGRAEDFYKGTLNGTISSVDRSRLLPSEPTLSDRGMSQVMSSLDQRVLFVSSAGIADGKTTSSTSRSSKTYISGARGTSFQYVSPTASFMGRRATVLASSFEQSSFPMKNHCLNGK